MQSDGDRDGDVRAILDSLRRIVRDLRRPGAAGPSPLSPAQHFILHALREGESLSVNDVADRTYTHQSSVSVVVRTLVDRGHVVRKTSAADRRRAELTLTRAGRAALRRASETPQVRLLGGIAKLPPQSRKRLAATLSELVWAMGLHGERPEMFFSGEARPRGDDLARS